ncbi:hypothetical protein L1787_07250 [Acuticoccus sp. M5D2P5]|uniref:hypothetical protein n=1 Tax=Acuticoccus kalidii TaxID=2910977 RepID=UPI001F261319|nr:hypothetical protein [Acuticoccus kalidii]MCF3933207.1 hypothetical protein [Acuticoccus kalidii]
MSVFGRYAVAALVFTGSVAAAAYAANHEDFYNKVTGSVAGLTDNMVMASTMLSGDAHLANPYEDMPTKRETDRIESASVVTHVEVIGGGKKQRIVLLDPDGREVYSHDPLRNTTVIAKDTIIPSITVRDSEDDIAELRVVTAAPAIEAPEELRQALATGAADQPELFYREDL